MPTSILSSTVHYKIEVQSQGVLLKIWEPKPPTEERPSAFLFSISYLLKSRQEAQEVLRHYQDWGQLEV
jgi:catechol-2,3-dioxygenase